MVVQYPIDTSKIEKGIEELGQKKWYQKWWGILILGILAIAIVTIIFYFLSK